MTPSIGVEWVAQADRPLTEGEYIAERDEGIELEATAVECPYCFEPLQTETARSMRVNRRLSRVTRVLGPVVDCQQRVVADPVPANLTVLVCLACEVHFTAPLERVDFE